MKIVFCIYRLPRTLSLLRDLTVILKAMPLVFQVLRATLNPARIFPSFLASWSGGILLPLLLSCVNQTWTPAPKLEAPSTLLNVGKGVPCVFLNSLFLCFPQMANANALQIKTEHGAARLGVEHCTFIERCLPVRPKTHPRLSGTARPSTSVPGIVLLVPREQYPPRTAWTLPVHSLSPLGWDGHLGLYPEGERWPFQSITHIAQTLIQIFRRFASVITATAPI